MTAHLEFLNYISDALDCGRCADKEYLDFSKAFDNVKDRKRQNAKSQYIGARSFQRDIDDLTWWSKTCDMKFNVSKCCNPHFGPKDINGDYNIKGIPILNRNIEKDQRVIFSCEFSSNGEKS